MPRARGSGKGLVEKRVRYRDAKGKERTRVYLYARISYTDAGGKRRERWRRVENRTDATDKKQILLRELREEEPQAVRARNARRRFGELATYYKTTSLVAAEYRDDRKIKGRRSLDKTDNTLRRLCEFFGATAHPTDEGVWEGGVLLDSITYDLIDEFRLSLLAQPVRVRRIRREKREGQRKLERIEYHTERPRKIASVNRTLETLRNMLRTARRKGWMSVDPFNAGDRALISSADEVRRTRLLSFEEEAALYEQCTEKRTHLRAIVMCALDTAMRAGELFSLTVGDYRAMQAHARTVTIQQLNTKTLQTRGAPISRRLREAIDERLSTTTLRDSDRLFGVTTVKRSFAAACAAAGIQGLRFHDLRRTAATRLHRGVPELGIQGMPIGEISRILGHASITTTYRYIAVDAETTERAADMFDQINEHARLKLVKKKTEAA